MFDLTPNIKLNSRYQRIYRSARTLLHIFFIIGVFFAAFKILFPSQTLSLYMENLNAAKNTIVNARLEESSQTLSKGVIEEDQTLVFDANPFGQFSSAEALLITDGDYQPDKINLKLRKSYQAFFYPEGKPLGFKTGSLITTNNGNYYIVSGGLLRRFANTDIILNFGYPKEAFQIAQENDLTHTPQGPEITSSVTYPEDTIFFIDEKFYQLKEGKLFPFLSSRAYLSQYPANLAVSKGAEIFNTYPESEHAIGFADATIASAGGSAFILSQGKSYPIADFNTFEIMGFSWDKVVALESDELGSYEQQKQFTASQPHPNGTIFLDKQAGTYSMIDNGQKRPIMGEGVLKTYPLQNAISVDSKSLTTELGCDLKNGFPRLSHWTCQIPLDEVSNLIGNNYQFKISFEEQIKIKEIHLTYFTPMTWQNMLNSLSKIKGNLKNNYSVQ